MAGRTPTTRVQKRPALAIAPVIDETPEWAPVPTKPEREDDGVLEGANRLESSVPLIAGAGRFFDDRELVMPSVGGRRARGCLRRGWEAPFAEPCGARAARRGAPEAGVDFS